MAKSEHSSLGNPLLTQLRWFVRLRWVAGTAVVIGVIADHWWLNWFRPHPWFVAVGATVLLYNVALWLWLRRAAPPRDRDSAEAEGPPPARPTRPRTPVRQLLVLAWAQILLDLSCLTVLTLWSGGAFSPLLAFFVFHMVFASLLLPPRMGYGGAAVAAAMVTGGLHLSGRWPVERAGVLILIGWVVTLLMTVYLANHITRGLHGQRRRLARQNRRIRQMSNRLRVQQQAMIQHEKMAALGQMAAGVAHEISNPLASMDGLLQLIQRTPDRQRPEAIQTLREQVTRISTIIRQMNTFSHPAVPTGLRPMRELVAEAMDMLRWDRRLSRVQVQMDLSPACAAGCLQAESIQQVVVNLLLNALDAMENTPDPRLTLRTHRDGSWCVLTVSDNGHGISPEHLDRLFDPFFTTKPVGKGTGLGLAISYSLVGQQGGKISVDSEPGKGSTFTVHLPAMPNPSYSQEADKA